MEKAKALAAFIGAMCMALSQVLADDVLGLDEVGALVALAITGVATVYAVYRVPNRPQLQEPAETPVPEPVG